MEEYTGSQHYDKDPFKEIDNALTANTPESVRNTLENRLRSKKPSDEDSRERLMAQIAYLDSKNV